MMRKIISIIAIALFSVNAATAQQEEQVTLEAPVNEVYKSQLGFSLVEFKLLQSSEYTSRVEVSIENLQPSETLMLFHSDKSEKQLKKNTPKMVFDKTFGGDKGRRRVSGCPEVQYITEIAPSQKTKFYITVNNGTVKDLVIPFYFVKDEKTWWGGRRTKILKEEVIKYAVRVKVWDESNEQFVAYRDSVENLVESLKGVEFCAHKQHKQSLESQQLPYKTAIDDLVEHIDMIRRAWTSDQAPHKAYSRLMEQLRSINLDDYNIENCGLHVKKGHSCSYCSLTAEQIYHQLDDLFQSLHVGKITKAEATKKANALYQCYQQNTKRKKASNLNTKISNYYNRIVQKK